MAARQTVGLAGTVAIGLASMLGAGVFVVFREGYLLAGTWVWAALGLAALVAALNSSSVYRLARIIDRPGGTYAYARVFLGEGWSFAAGFAFVAGKIGSIAAIALALGEYVYAPARKWVGIAAIIVMTLINVLGIQRTAGVAAVLAGVTTTFVLVTVLLGLALPVAPIAEVRLALPTEPSWYVITAASIFFFAFAGYARVATLGNEVRDAKRNIPRAIVIVMAAVTVLYFGVLFVLQTWLRTNLAISEAPFVAFFDQALPGFGWVVLPVVVVATLGSILALLAGVSRTAAEMASDRELPRVFEARNRFGSPWLSEVAIALGASLLVLVADNLAWAIGFSSFAVLFYYAVAHLSVCFMRDAGLDAVSGAVPRRFNPLARIAPIIGIALCLTLAMCVPGPAFAVSSTILIVAVAIRALLRPKLVR
mgnify:CR=1 FL=1